MGSMEARGRCFHGSACLRINTDSASSNQVAVKATLSTSTPNSTTGAAAAAQHSTTPLCAPRASRWPCWKPGASGTPWPHRPKATERLFCTAGKNSRQVWLPWEPKMHSRSRSTCIFERTSNSLVALPHHHLTVLQQGPEWQTVVCPVKLGIGI